ncbi:MAG TPA: hypothetical protein VMT64_04105 [Candidatus Binataceae bacterium]|nr:hypothetical protein [Candidatus Binataceae bacterium]
MALAVAAAFVLIIVVAIDEESHDSAPIEIPQPRASRLLRNDKGGARHFISPIEPSKRICCLLDPPLVFEEGRCGPHLMSYFSYRPNRGVLVVCLACLLIARAS